jgi:hypothetical protein
MTTLETKPQSVSTEYPRADVIAALKKELLEGVRAQALRHGTPLTETDNELLAANIAIDSLMVVEMLCALDEVLPFEVQECVVQAGGYGSIEGALSHVADRIEAKWRKHVGVKHD